MPLSPNQLPKELLDVLVSEQLFDAQDYVKRYPDVLKSGLEPLEHFLGYGWYLNRRPSAAFDPKVYLDLHPDVKAAGVNPLFHYLKNGIKERRATSFVSPLACDFYLWRGLEALYVPILQELIETSSIPDEVRSAYAVVLCRWWAYQQNWTELSAVLKQTLQLNTSANCHLCILFYAQLCFAEPKYWQANTLAGWISKCQCIQSEAFDVNLARSNLLALDESLSLKAQTEQRLTLINQCYSQSGLALIASKAPVLNLSVLAAKVPKRLSTGLPRVSVIVPVFNSAAYLEVAVRSLVGQTWPNLEIILIDDASTDDSLAICHRLQAQHTSPELIIKVEVNATNLGAYSSRNKGLALSTGDYITVHDADDWSHPQKIERQVMALLENASAKASLSHWVRCNDDLIFSHWRTDHGWTYRNTSSLLIPRSVFEALGYWDRVTVNADTEYLNRIVKAFGVKAVVEVLPGVPLAFGRTEHASLTQNVRTHLITQFNGLRKLYQDAAARWHQRASTPRDLYLPQNPVKRPFLVPKDMVLDQTLQTVETYRADDALQQSGWFDPVWYVYRYPEVRVRPQDPFTHFWKQGINKGYDPGPLFSLSGYQFIQRNTPDSHLPWQRETFMDENQRMTLPLYSRSRDLVVNQTTFVLICRTLNPNQERLKGWITELKRQGCQLVLCVPDGQDEQWLESVLSSVDLLVFLPALIKTDRKQQVSLSALFSIVQANGGRIDHVGLFEAVLPLDLSEILGVCDKLYLLTEQVPTDFVASADVVDHQALLSWSRELSVTFVTSSDTRASWAYFGQVVSSEMFLSNLDACES